MKMILRQPFLFVLLTSLTTATFGAPLGKAFTYQGKLAQGATPANGIYDFRFIREVCVWEGAAHMGE